LCLIVRRREPVIELPVAANEPMEVVTEETMETEESVEGEWAPDPNEPRYCLCNQVSYGDMVACDNPDVRVICYSIITIRGSIVR
jgi:inhibitor of growth protein 3